MPRGCKGFWTDELIERELRNITGALGWFPSAQELRAMDRNDLACKISKGIGFVAWAEKLGLPRQRSDSDFGWYGEDRMCDQFRGQGMQAERTRGVKAPFDIMVDGVLRVDVKTANRAEYGSAKRRRAAWYFRTGKIPQADLVVLYRADVGDFFGVPWWECTASNMSVGESFGRFAPFHNNWPIVRQMIWRRQSERELAKVLAEVA